MSLADRLSVPPSRRRECGAAKVIQALPKDDRDAVVKALADPRFTAPTLVEALRAEGHEVSVWMLSNHRRGGCSCGTR